MLLANERARVLVRPKPEVEGTSVYACVRGHRPTFVDLQTAETAVFDLRLVGTWLGYRYASARPGIGYGVNVFDVRRGARSESV